MSTVFAKNLYNFRLEHNLTQAKLGKKLGVTGSRVAHYEAGNGTPLPKRVERFCKVLAMTPAQLFGKRVASQMASRQ